MKTNTDVIQDVVDYIEDHLEDRLDLNSLSGKAGYSKYHLGRMFFNIVGFSLHTYIRRRRLTESARMLVFSERPVMDIALAAGYETQQSYTVGFKAVYKCSPQAFRKKREFYPLQLKYTVDGCERLRGDRIMDIRTVECGKILLVGYKGNTRLGFLAVRECWRKMNAKKDSVPDRKNTEFLIGVNDYAEWETGEEGQPAFDCYAASEVTKIGRIPKGMTARELPAGKYIVFSYRAKKEDSLQPVADYIYKEWLPHSTCLLNENAQYDFARYGEETGEDGKNLIEYWIPVL